MASPASPALSAEKLAELREAFALFVDPTGAGDAIPASSLGTAVRALGHNPTEAELAELGAGEVRFEEFVRIVDGLKDSKLAEADVVDAFRVLDKDGDGKIDAAELRSVLMARGEKLSEDEANQLVSLVDTDKDGKIDYLELSKVLMG